MENRKLIKVLVLIFILGFFVVYNTVFAYDTETHAYLTSEVVRFYNQHFFNNKISDELVSYFLDGSRREDDIPRWMNHFYDPVKNRGLSYDPAIDPINVGTWQRSKDWAQDSTNQNRLTYKVPTTIASILTAIQQLKISALSTETDFTWQRAVKFYIQGDKEKAMFILGHILHLIEDSLVPDHTRNDPHPGDSPYENYTQKFTLSNPDNNLHQNLSNKSPIILSSLNSYFDELAKYSNNNFYSKDTVGIQSGYELPEPNFINARLINNLYYVVNKDSEGNEYYLAAKKSLNNLILDLKYSLIIDEALVKDSYWSRLSTKSVQYGAGVINLFFQEVEKAKNEPSFLTVEKKSFLGQVVDSINNVISVVGQTISSVLNNNQGPQNLIQEIPLNSNTQPQDINPPANEENQKAQIIVDPKISLEKTEVKRGEVIHQRGQGFTPNSRVLINLESSNKKIEISILSDTKGNYDYAYLVPQEAVLGTYFYSATDSASGKVSAKLQYQVLGLEEPKEKVSEEKPSSLSEETPTSSLKISDTSLLNQPSASNSAFQSCSFATVQSPLHQKVIINEVAWMGTLNSASDEWIELKNISGSEIDLDGWQLIDKGEQIKVIFGQPDNRKIINKKIPAGGFYLLEKTDDNTLPTVTADFVYTGALSNSDEGLRLFDKQCNLIDEVLANPNWPAGNASTRNTLERDINGFGWHTSAISGGTPRQENTQLAPISPSGGGGGGSVSASSGSDSTSTSTSSPTNYPQIFINEIQIASASSSHDEFVELYNPNDADINLTNWYLQKKTASGSSFSTFVPKDSLASKIILSHNYLLIAHPSSTFSADVFTSYGIADNNTLILKNPNSEIVDKVGWGEAGDCENNCAPEPSDNQSIQRKFQNNTFVDTDNNANDFEIQSCPSPKAKTCQQANQAPSAFFVYAPQNPTVGEIITFNAASSSDPDPNDQIISYQWNFGDNTTSSATTTTVSHSYSQAGDYSVTLIVFDNQNASSTATSTTISVASGQNQTNQTNHLVISEIQVAGDEADDEFVEIYNPTTSTISLANWSIQYLSGTATSTEKIQKKNFANDAQIPAKGFYLIANSSATSSLVNKVNMSHNSFSLSGNSSGATIFLVSTTTPISTINDSTIIDSISYGNPQLVVSAATSTVPDSNKSLERRAFSDGVCVSSQNDGEFLGNGCDTDQDDDFETRESPNPQNSDSLPEPRIAPTINNFQVSYNLAPRIDFSWDLSSDVLGSTSTLSYFIYDISSSSFLIFSTSTASSSFIFNYSINEVGRNYDFEFKVQDRDGLSSIATSTVTAKSFLDNFYFYRDSRPSGNGYLFDLTVTSSRPFWNANDISATQIWKAIVFYLNKEAPKQEIISTEKWLVPDDSSFIPVNYYVCAGGESKEPELLLPFNQYSCQYGGPMSGAYLYDNLEDQRFTVKLSSSSSDISFSSTDYVTLAFYDFGGGGGGSQRLQLAAVDKTKYYFQTSLPPQASPAAPADISADFDDFHSALNLTWSSSTDSDTLGRLIVYQINYSTSSALDDSKWQLVGNNLSAAVNVVFGETYVFGVRAVDDFQNISTPTVANWSFPEGFTPLPSQGEHDSFIGMMTGGSQKITMNATATIDAVAMWIGPSGGWYNSSISYLAVYRDNDGSPGDQVATSTFAGVGQYEGDREVIYLFDSPLTLEAGASYWLAPIVGPADRVNPNSSKIFGSSGDAYSDGFWSANAGADAYFRLRQAE